MLGSELGQSLSYVFVVEVHRAGLQKLQLLQRSFLDLFGYCKVHYLCKFAEPFLVLLHLIREDVHSICILCQSLI